MPFWLQVCWTWSLPRIFQRLKPVPTSSSNGFHRSTEAFIRWLRDTVRRTLVSPVPDESYRETNALVRCSSGRSCMGYRDVGDPFTSKCGSWIVSAVEPGAWGVMSGSAFASCEGLSFACSNRSSLAKWFKNSSHRLPRLPRGISVRRKIDKRRIGVAVTSLP